MIIQRLKYLFISYLLAFLSSPAEARRLLPVIDGTCPNIEIIAEYVKDQDLLSKVLEQTTRINLEKDQGIVQYLTYSFDAELETPGFVKFILSEPEGVAALNKLYGEYTIDDACHRLMLSPAQLKTFALNTGVDKTKSTYALSDFRLKYIVDLVHSAGGKYQGDLIKIIQETAHKKQRMLKVAKDEKAIETRDPSFRDSPNAIENIIHVLTNDFGPTQLHLHLGLPSRVISLPEARAIAMAIETVLVLGRAAKEPGTYHVDKPVLNQGSPLANYPGRGAVYLKSTTSGEGFEDPFPAHDLEIRKADSDEQQLHFLALGIVLAKNYKRLNVDDHTYTERLTVEKNLGNLYGALLYAAKLFERSNIDDNKRVAPLLRSLAEKITLTDDPDYYELSPELAEEIFQFLNQKQIVQRLTTNLFLNP